MSNQGLEQIQEARPQQISLDWTDNPSIQKLLDVVVSIIAEEYIEVAKKNKDIFVENVNRKEKIHVRTPENNR